MTFNLLYVFRNLFGGSRSPQASCGFSDYLSGRKTGLRDTVIDRSGGITRIVTVVIS